MYAELGKITRTKLFSQLKLLIKVENLKDDYNKYWNFLEDSDSYCGHSNSVMVEPVVFQIIKGIASLKFVLQFKENKVCTGIQRSVDNFHLQSGLYGLGPLR